MGLRRFAPPPGPSRTGGSPWPRRPWSWLGLSLGGLVLGAVAPEREDRRRPGPEVLGRDVVAARGLAQVLVDVLGADGSGLAVVVDVLEEVLAGQLLAAPDDRREASVDQLALLGAAALAPEPEADGRAA